MRTTPNRAERTEHDYRCSICRATIGIYSHLCHCSLRIQQSLLAATETSLAARNEVRRLPYSQAIVIVATLGSFSIDDGNGREKVSFEMNSRFFSLCRLYSNLLKMASVGEFPWS